MGHWVLPRQRYYSIQFPFTFGLHFVLRGVQEQHDLTVSQLVRVPVDHSIYTADVYYEYKEYVSKTSLHRFKDSRDKIRS